MTLNAVAGLAATRVLLSRRPTHAANLGPVLHRRAAEIVRLHSRGFPSCDHRAASLRRATDFARGRATREILARLREGRPSEIRAASGAISHFAVASRRVGPVRDSPRGSGADRLREHVAELAAAW